MIKDYHSALTEEKQGLKGVNRYTVGNSEAFVWDIEKKGLPTNYDGCDILYAEIPWKSGYDKFNERAGVKEDRRYINFINSVKLIIRDASVVTVIIVGKLMVKMLPASVQVFNVRLHFYGCFALVYNHKLDIKEVPKDINTEGFIELLAKHYNRIGDFVCGYGSAGKIFREHNKEFIMSDINPKCIGYISENIK